MRRSLTVSVLALAALAFPSLANAAELRGIVGPEFTITLVDERGARVTHVAPGEYTLRVDDRSPFHNFHLIGPGVDVSTGVDETGTSTWTITLTDGIYDFVCDPHASTMNGRFAVGTATLPPATPPAPHGTTPATRRLVATVGPGSAITLRTAAGARVTTLRRGTYTIVVRDRSRVHNFHLVGRGVNRQTPVARTGTFTWRVTFRPGTYRFVCDPHARGMRGSFRVR